MAPTILFGDREPVSVAALPDGDRLWLSAEDVETATGWALKPEGLCQGDACVPLPADGSWRDGAGRVDVAAFAQRFGRPVVRDDAHDVWAFGAPAQAPGREAGSVEAPDFTLPDVDGRTHSLSDYRGRKIFLLAWGSY